MPESRPRTHAPSTRTALPSLPTGEIRLSPQLVSALRSIAPKPRRRALPYVIALALGATIAAFALVAPLRARAIAAVHGGWTRAAAHVETPAAASEPPPAPPPVIADAPAPALVTTASLEAPVAPSPVPPTKPHKASKKPHRRASH